MNPENIQPQYLKQGFNCPHCKALAAMDWSLLKGNPLNTPIGFSAAQCYSCNARSIWRMKIPEALSTQKYSQVLEGEMVYPQIVSAPKAHPLMPEEIKTDYEEARQIALLSPRAAAALLRLCVEKLCQQLTQTTDKINDQIKQLVRDGLPTQIQQALDTVRVIGNHAVHPGRLDIDDTEKYVTPLFGLINIIIESQIAQPAAIAALYSSLPAGQLAGIEARDKPKL